MSTPGSGDERAGVEALMLTTRVQRGDSMLEYNCLIVRFDEAKSITPGFHSPTIRTLPDPALVASEVMVKKPEVPSVMDSLEPIGATGILETEVRKCRLGGLRAGSSHS